MSNHTTQTETAMNAWTQLVHEHIQRLDSAFEEATRRQEQMVAQVNGTVDELSKLMKDSMALQTQLTGEWMKIARGTTQRASEFVNTMTAQ